MFANYIWIIYIYSLSFTFISVVYTGSFLRIYVNVARVDGVDAALGF